MWWSCERTPAGAHGRPAVGPRRTQNKAPTGRVAVPQLAEWARTKAIPATAEIRTVRTLIRAGEDTLNELAPAERARLLELFRVLRATRARMDGTIGIEQVAGTRNPEPTFTPPAFTPLPTVPARQNRTAAP